MSSKYLPQLDYIRAIASLAVCVFHLACGNENLLHAQGILYHIAKYGWLGVEMFFVLSGFVICWSIPANYSLLKYGNFLTRRLVRIEPPYLISIVLVIIVGYMSAYVRNESFEVSFLNLFYHLGYLNNLGFGEYLNVVYWTLGIEFQFYILIGLLFPLLLNSIQWSLAGLIGISFLALFDWPFSLILEFTPFFAMGMLAFLFMQGHIGKNVFLIVLIILSIILFIALGGLKLTAALITVGIICVSAKTNVVIQFFSKISYSLYLIHVPIGGKVINLGLRKITAQNIVESFLLFLVAFAISIVCAYLFYLIAEKPFIQLSKKVSYKL